MLYLSEHDRVSSGPQKMDNLKQKRTKCKNSALELWSQSPSEGLDCPRLELSTAGGYTCTCPVCCGILDLNKLPVIVNVRFLCGLSGVCAASCLTHQCRNKCTLF